MNDAKIWADYGLPVMGMALGIILFATAYISSRQFKLQFGEAQTRTEPLPLSIRSPDGHMKLYQRLTKRWMDIAVASIALVLLLPLFLLIAAAIWLSDGGSPMFRHRRLGRGGKSFYCLKFRSMSPNSDQVLETYLNNNPAHRAEFVASGRISPDPRVTKVGNILRKSSLDELPQLINVMRGEMSLVGPRPIGENQIDRYSNAFYTCFSVPPGMFEPWEVLKLKDTKGETRISAGIDYATHWSLTRDLVVLARAIPAVIIGRGSH